MSIAGDMSKFRNETIKNKYVIMGKKTFLSLPNNSLPDRKIILVSSTWNRGEGLITNYHRTPVDLYIIEHVVKSLDEAAEYTNGVGSVAGGVRLYEDAIMNPNCTSMLLTRVHKSFDVDTFFPKDFDLYFKLSMVEGEMISKLKHKDGRIDNVPITFERWVRKSY